MSTDLNKLAEGLGYSFLYHFNTYTGKWAAFNKDSINFYFNGDCDKSNIQHIVGYGLTLEDAIDAAVLQQNKLDKVNL